MLTATGAQLGGNNYWLPSMTCSDVVSCPMCLAVYQKRREKRRFKEQGGFTCSCGHKFTKWLSFWVPIFTKLTELPSKSKAAPVGPFSFPLSQ